MTPASIACGNRHYRKLFWRRKVLSCGPPQIKPGIKVQVYERDLKKCRKQWDSVPGHHTLTQVRCFTTDLRSGRRCPAISRKARKTNNRSRQKRDIESGNRLRGGYLSALSSLSTWISALRMRS